MRDGEDHRRGAESGKMDANGEMGVGDKEAMAEAMAEVPKTSLIRTAAAFDETPNAVRIPVVDQPAVAG